MCVGTWLAIVRVIFAQYRYPYELGSRSRFATVATLLVLFGFLGAHRFFVGKIVSGALYLVTMGFLGIGVLIDGILLMCRKFKDKEGNVI
jgi:hypothetical protein